MNKVIVQQFQALDHYRWFERITSVEPNDGTLQAMKWITLGGVGNLPSVTEGAAYTELSVADVTESAAFVKRGGYVGITREMIKNSNIQQLQAIPRALAVAAVRTRSSAVAALFTAGSGVGPTLAQDSKALFHDDHDNLATDRLRDGRNGVAGGADGVLRTGRGGQRQTAGHLPALCAGARRAV